MIMRLNRIIYFLFFLFFGLLISACGKSSTATLKTGVVTDTQFPSKSQPVSISPTLPLALTATPPLVETKTQQPPILPKPTSELSRYEFPDSIDSSKRYLFYLHGRIIEEQGLQAVSPEFGPYAYQAILERLASFGFTVISEQRLKDTDVTDYAKIVLGQIDSLIQAEVPANQITVVGASKGAIIAATVSHLSQNPDLNFVLLGTCNADIVTDMIQSQMNLYGNVLAIYDSADVEFSGSCRELFGFSEGKGLSRHEEIVLQVGTGHGILYQPLDEWVLPTVDWARGGTD
jgi:hypothetical protein